jgi:hypothetical protein
MPELNRLQQMERDAATVKKDVATLSNLRADDWIGQSPDGIQTKAQAMVDLKSKGQKFDFIHWQHEGCGSSETVDEPKIPDGWLACGGTEHY